MNIVPFRKILVIAIIICALPSFVRAHEMTAFEAVKEGNREVGATNRDQIIEIQGDHTANNRYPSKWQVLYHDPAGTFKSTTRVIFESGRKTDVQHPQRIFEGVTSGNKTIDLRKLNLDSDQVIDVAEHDSELLEAHVKITSSQMALSSTDAGPVWEVRLWAARSKSSSSEAAIGMMTISAEDGTILKREIKLEKPREPRDRNRDKDKTKIKDKDADK
jgi:hypothetical protein